MTSGHIRGPQSSDDKITGLRIYRDIAARIGKFLPNHGNLPYELIPTGRLRLLLVNRLAPKYRNRPTIFCINSGRVGSGFLARILASADRVAAFHEPRPRMTGGYLRLADSKPLSETYARRSIKVLGIMDRMRRTPKDAVYAETSHMFIKVFHDVVLDVFSNARVVILRRDIVATLKSLIDLGYFSDTSWHWRIWMQSRTSSTAAVATGTDFEELDPVDRAIAYLFDIEGRVSRFKRQYPEVPVVETRLEEINSIEGAGELLTSLDLQVVPEKLQQAMQLTNARTDLKGHGGQRISRQECIKRIDAYASALKDSEIKLVGPLLNGVL